MNNVSDWQLAMPVGAIAFDFDSTLSHIEGIDELAKMRGVEKEVSKITAECMNNIGINQEFYAKRLELTQPSLSAIKALTEMYLSALAPQALEVITLFQKLNKTVYVISGGLYQAILPICTYLNILPTHVFAVEVLFDENGNYRGFDTNSALIKSDGKPIVIEQIKQQHAGVVMIGDGMSDLMTVDYVDRFIGYGGCEVREKVRSASPFYIQSSSLLPLLPLCLTAAENDSLTAEEKILYAKGLDSIKNKEVSI